MTPVARVAGAVSVREAAILASATQPAKLARVRERHVVLVGRDATRSAFDQAIARLRRRGLIERWPDGANVATDAGRAALRAWIDDAKKLVLRMEMTAWPS